MGHRVPNLVGFKDPPQQLTTLWLGPDDLIEKLMDLLLERLVFVHRWPVVVDVSFLLHRKPTLVGPSSHEGEDGALVADVGLEILLQDSSMGRLSRHRVHPLGARGTVAE